MMTKEESTKIVNFMTLRAGVLMLGVAIEVIIVNMYYLLFQYYSTLIAIVLRDYDDAYLLDRLFTFFSMMRMLIIEYMYEPI